MTNKEILRRLYDVIKPYKNKLVVAMIAMILVAVFTGSQAYLVRDLLDKIFIERNQVYLDLLPFAVVAIFFLKGGFYYLYNFLLEQVGQSIIRDLRIRIFEHVHTQPLSFFQSMPTGTLISRVISDVNLMQGAVSNAMVSILRDFFQVIILLGVIFYMNWKLALFSLLILPLAFSSVVFFGRLFRRLSIRSQEETARMSNILHETITGNRIVKAFGMEEYEGKRFRDQVYRLFNVIIQDAKLRSLQHPLMEFIGGIAIALIIWFGGSEVISGNATPGAFFSFLTALIMAYDPVKGVSKINSTIQQGMAAASRVFSLLDVRPEIADRTGATVLPEFRRAITFDHVSFEYDSENKVLHDIHLEIKKGEVLAIVGPSGSGKTTLTNLIPRFFEVTEGRILIDGLDIRDVTLQSLRNQISMVTQQTILFNDTIRNNIAYGDLDRSEEEIREAARAAHALEFIENFPDGFDTVIGESGMRLSGGERQRISIARAILKNAPILILDEATSALDTESERDVQRALENLMKNRTTVVIAHRLSTIVNADRIIVIKDGRIVEEGSHEDLLELRGEYELLHRMQYK
ncbi:lipid A export permease/ATP-binding protein MsbA [Desulfolithobacter dissulfuricans]|uniref:Lipid A export permease/ATP-binding protein MsbA n=1 Tax=Desulfolithobacter dissulfuricans TaxID=2795293 RepID=A0A915UAB9_9BACT|nr:lipid A export permease/ATP-binding protein MsbA [Desulfolithobacter dissulfuricans]BCO09816.1 lipid A export permease/ATP-binding protein MsbA [Desulfolithobacter dissulfuricans]